MGNDDLVADIQNVRFPVTRLRRGYDMGQVDDFLDRLVAAVGTDEPVRPLVDAVLFRAVRSNGYDEQAVDRFLDQVVAGQEADGGRPVARPIPGTAAEPTPAPAPAAPAPAAVPPTAVPPAPPVTASTGAAEPLPTAIEEQKGLFARLFGR